MRESRLENIGLLVEYECILLKKRKSFTSTYMGKTTPAKNARSVFRFAFEDILDWTPQMVMDNLSPELINILRLQKPLSRIEFPPELNRNVDLFYLAWIMYPEKIHIRKKDIVLRCYENVRLGKISKFPKNFFSEASGILNASICLQYVINRKMHFRDVKELYGIFAIKEKIVPILKENQLYAPCCEFYEYPIDFLHASLPEKDQDELCYNFERFKLEYALEKGKGL